MSVLNLRKSVASPPQCVSQKAASPPPKTASPPRNAASPPKGASPPQKGAAPPQKTTSPPQKVASPPQMMASPPQKVGSPPRKVAPPVRVNPTPPKREDSISSKTEPIPPPKKDKETTSPPISSFKFTRADSKVEDKVKMLQEAIENKETPKVIDIPEKMDKVSVEEHPDKPGENDIDSDKIETEKSENIVSEESNGVGDKIKKFEKAAEDAGASFGRMSRPGSVRGRSRTERLGSDSKEDLPPPATPFKDNVHFELGTGERSSTVVERQQSSTRSANSNPTSVAARWQRSESNSIDAEKPKQEPTKIIKPEFKPIASPVDVTIRSPSLGAKIPDRFPSHGTAFRNVAAEDPKSGKLKNKEKYSVSKGSSYFTRGSEEIWLVKKKDIEEIEERVLDSFRRAGGNPCARSESTRAASEGFPHATMGRNKRQMYARSESLDPAWAGGRAHTLKRQSSVACTCGHDKKTRARPPGPGTPSGDPPRPRSRSHGDDHHTHVLDKYETLV